jgi:hypothetical protein
LAFGAAAFALGGLPLGSAAEVKSTPSIAAATAGLKPLEGLLPVYLDEAHGRILAAFSPDAAGGCGEYLYQVYMRSGLGSTPIGIDRSNPGPTQIVAFRKVGAKVVAELENPTFRAPGGGPEERAAVAESFPRSIVWSGDVVAVNSDGRILVDLTGFLTRDAFGVVDALTRAKQGAFKLDAGRTYADVDQAQVFPDNLEFEAHQTFVSDAPGGEVRALAPDPHAVTLIAHQSLIRLPAPGFTPRLADPRTGAFDTLVADYGAPLGAPIVYRLANRFRLEKIDPSAARSTVKKPIIFYVDRAAPEPVRTALVEGARWWAQAFEAAGFIDAFRVEVLPEGVSPLDARYNVINWVHRQTRGWSYGYGVVDPRTGEIVKGAVLLGSLRVRQDRLIFEGLAGADRTGLGGPQDPIVISLARLRQLAVHETGHAIGLAHNFAGSTYDDRASVMDYPPPRIAIVNGDLDFSDAYKVGLGRWDRFAIRWLYGDVPAGTAGRAALERVVREGYASGLRYVSDDDARPVGSANPYGALWDDGPDAVSGLDHVLAVRRIALSRFGPRNLPPGAPLSDLRRVIVPVYLFHRYEVEAVAKLIGGVEFGYGVRDDGSSAPRVVAPASQRRAMEALLATLDPDVLDLPADVIDQLSAGRDGAADKQYDIELFTPPATPVFSINDAAAAAADITLAALFEPSRLERVSDQSAREDGGLTLGELMDRTIGAVFSEAPLSGRRAALRRVVQARLIVRLASVLEDRNTSPATAAEVRGALDRLGARLASRRTGAPADVAQARYWAQILQSAAPDRLAELAAQDRRREAAAPPGMPIGADDGCWFCEPAAADF